MTVKQMDSGSFDQQSCLVDDKLSRMNVLSGANLKSDDLNDKVSDLGPVEIDVSNDIKQIASQTAVAGPSGLNCVLSKSTSRSAHRQKVTLKSASRRSSLRSADRVLRSRSAQTAKSSPEAKATTEHIGRKRKRRMSHHKRGTSTDELSKISQRVRYLIGKMKYEQNLIDAYSGEGWKGQNQDKVRPEGELKRAASELLRCKLKIRDFFQQLDSLCSEGKLQESLFDSEGQIYSEDIFCAKCGSKESAIDNDIILCDGICDRGFHQMCLDPPLLKEQIPPGDESWLCPGCNCKLRLIDSLNGYIGTNLSVEDNWEKIFPEAAAKADGVEEEDLGLQSDSSGDFDYDPDRPDRDMTQQSSSSSDESDFTSETSNSKSRSSLGMDEGPESSGSSVEGEDANMVGPETSVLSSPVGNGNSVRSSRRKCSEGLDYKKLYDDTYGNLPESSSDDDFDDETASPGNAGNEEAVKLPARQRLFRETRKGCASNKSRQKLVGSSSQAGREPQKKSVLLQDPFAHTPFSEATLNLTSSNLQLGVTQDLVYNKDLKSSPYKRTPEAHKKLHEVFREHQYPTRELKDELASDLGMSLKQISKWFEHQRKRAREKASCIPSEEPIVAADKVSEPTLCGEPKAPLVDLDLEGTGEPSKPGTEIENDHPKTAIQE